MARKKKKTVENKPVQSIGYSGRIKLALRSGRTVILTKTYNNNGFSPLFEFLSYCLAGQYSAANEIRPSKIMLWNSSGDPTACNLDSSAQASGFISNNTAATISKTKDTTIFHFLIPKIYITNQQFNQIALYGNTISDKKNPSALFNLVSNGSWEGINISEWADNFNLVVEWEMTVSNK